MQDFDCGAWYRIDKVLAILEVSPGAPRGQVHVLALKSAVDKQVDDLCVWIDYWIQTQPMNIAVEGMDAAAAMIQTDSIELYIPVEAMEKRKPVITEEGDVVPSAAAHMLSDWAGRAKA